MEEQFYRSLSDIRIMISGTPIDPSFYVEDYVTLVTEAYIYLLESKGWKGWYDSTPAISEEEFWGCFKCAEKDNKEAE